jgi:release factor glutamine methyltransferase
VSDRPSSPEGTLTWRALWVETTSALAGAADEARWLCQAASGCEGGEWLDALDQAATAGGVRRLDAMVARRRQGEPIQYVLGAWGFRQLDLFVDRRVLIPRPETEQVVEVALDLVRRRPRPIVVAELGTGSGAIALSLATELPITGVEVWATDAASGALDVARANLAGIGRPAANVRLAEGDWFDALPAELRGRLDLVVANPPYVATTDPLDDDVRAWEPMTALLAGPDGLDDLRRIIGDAPAWLAPGASLVLEIGATQGRAVAALGREAGFADVAIHPDLAGRDRIVTCRDHR